MNIPCVDYRTLIEELRSRFAGMSWEPTPEDMKVIDNIRYRMAGLLEASPDTPIQEIIDQLAEKWRQDGLI